MSMKVKSSVTYTQLSYIESTGTQFIDTGFIPNNNTRVIIDFEIISQPINVYYTIFSSRSNSYSNAYCVFSQNVTGAPNTTLDSYGTNRDVTLQHSLIGRHVIDKNKNNVILDNTTIYQHDYNEFNSVCELRILADNKPDGGDGHYFVGKLYSCQIYDNDILIRDYIPVIDYKNIICLFDKVHGQFYYNSGTGNFVSGEVVETVTTDAWVEGKEYYYKTNDNIWQKPQSIFAKVSDSYTPVDYIESTGTQWIDTCYYSNPNTCVEIDFQFTDLTTMQRLFSARGGLQYVLYINSSGKLNFIYQDNTFSGTGTNVVADIHRHVARLDGYEKTMSIDGVVTNSLNNFTATMTNTDTLQLFVDKKSLSTFAKAKFYACKIWDNGILIRDFIPVIDKNGVACMYDKVHGQFYYNQGTGDFIAAETSHVEVEYLESTGSQYIDTELSMQNGFRAVLDISYTSLSQKMLIGARDADGTNQQFFWGFPYEYTTYDYVWQFGLGSGGYYNCHVNGMQPNVIYHIDASTFVNNICLSVDGVNLVNGASGTGDTGTRTSLPLYLFALNDNTQASLHSNIKLYSCKLYDNNNIIVRDYIPVRDQNNIPCLYDKVEGKYYYNQGTGEFLAPTKGYTELEYIESNGNQYVDTKVTPNPNTTFKTSFTPMSYVAKYNMVFGSRTTHNTNAFYIGFSNENHSYCCRGTNKKDTEISSGWSTLGKRYNVWLNNSDNYIYCNSRQVYEFASTDFSQSLPILLFADNDGGNVNEFSNIRLYSFKIYDNGVLVRDFIPVKDYKGTPCLYDKVYNRYYYDENNYGFTGGKIAGCFGWKQVI